MGAGARGLHRADGVGAARRRAAHIGGARRAGPARRRRFCSSFCSRPIRFVRLDPPPFEGAGLNPLLQDPGLAIHPPMLYLGYVGLSATFAYAAAALITGDADARWARAARPFMLVAWIALTLGITLGSWWAYYVLGWGGFWFWDPVENAALMPWLVATALLHSALATERTGAFRSWTLLLAIAAFSLEPDRHVPRALRRARLGARLRQRSRARRVHSRCMLGVAIGGALALFAWRAPKLEERRRVRARQPRDARCCSTMCFSRPPRRRCFSARFIRWCSKRVTGERISVGPPYFAITLRADLRRAADACAVRSALAGRRAISRGVAHAGAGGGCCALSSRPRGARDRDAALAGGGGAFALAGWVIAASVDRLCARKADAHALSAATLRVGARACRARRLASRHRRHDSVAQRGARRAGARDRRMQVAGYDLRFDGVEPAEGPNYHADARHRSKCCEMATISPRHLAGEAHLSRRRPGDQQHGDPHDGFLRSLCRAGRRSRRRALDDPRLSSIRSRRSSGSAARSWRWADWRALWRTGARAFRAAGAGGMKCARLASCDTAFAHIAAHRFDAVRHPKACRSATRSPRGRAAEGIALSRLPGPVAR